jgi:hypothetical protein
MNVIVAALFVVFAAFDLVGATALVALLLT